MKILFAISSLWLGHTTRSLAIIKHFLNKWYEVDIISFWNALNYLKQELKNKKVFFIELEDYPALERGKGIMFYFYLIWDLLKTKKLIKKEHKFLENLLKNKNYNYIFSDWRYWIYSKKIPSFLISHQLSFIMPKWLEIFEGLSDKQNLSYFKKFTKILIPDYKDKNNNLAWALSHPKWIDKINHKYIWILSDFNNARNSLNKKENNEVQKAKAFCWQKIDYLFTITWYLQEHKKNFLDKLILEAKKLNWKKVFVLWDTSKKYIKKLENNITLISNVSGQEKIDLFKNADIIISRSWYTTIMDLVELNKKAILYPTPNQTEQEYLAEYLEKKWLFVIWNKNIKLEKLIEKISKTKKLDFDKKTKDALEIIDKEILC